MKSFMRVRGWASNSNSRWVANSPLSKKNHVQRRFCVEVALALAGAMDEATLARATEALRVRLDGSPGTPE